MTTLSRARSADGVPIRFEVGGEGEPTLVLVHGWALDRRLWDEQLPRLEARQRVVTLDLAGHGESGRRPGGWTMAAFGEDVRAVVEAVGAQRVTLVGHSMGGNVVVEAARGLGPRVEGVVLVDTLLDVEERTPAEEIDAMAHRLEADYESTVSEMVREYLFAPATPAAVRERVLGQARALPPEVSIAVLRECWAHDVLPALREIHAPIVAVNADRFPTNLDANRRHMRGYEAILVRGSGHYPMLEDPARFGDALEVALARLASLSR